MNHNLLISYFMIWAQNKLTKVGRMVINMRQYPYTAPLPYLPEDRYDHNTST